MKEYSQFKNSLAVSDCRLCPLSAGRTQIVVDRGNPEARVIFIGEAPGKNEDLKGHAFVGRSGKLLDTMMKAVAEFDTDRDGLIINVVKCRPPGNRAPSPDEVMSCAPFLRKQLELVRPKIIVLLGATALRHLIPGKKNFSMEREVGKFFEHKQFPGIQFIVFYHPAFILRNSTKRPAMEGHIRQFKELWNSG